MKRASTICTALVLVLAGCGDKNLRKMQSDDKGPEEFTVMPLKPLEQPRDYAALPKPENAAASITDPTPIADAITALGGTIDSRSTTLIPSTDRALIQRTDRFGTASNIRAELALEDAQFRKSKTKMRQALFKPRDPYSLIYEAETLDAFAELQKFQAKGVTTPAVPQ